MKAPGAKGVWPAFWLCGDAGAGGIAYWLPEIDILEFVNNGRGDDIPTRYHVNCIMREGAGWTNVWGGAQVFKAPDFHGSGGGGYLRADYEFPADYHIYACYWSDDGTVSWRVDGRMFSQSNTTGLTATAPSRRAPLLYSTLRLAAHGPAIAGHRLCPHLAETRFPQNP